ncbi:MAG: hypothetical protein ACM31C_29320, partial [Acidobacteriota bacterium]
MEQTELIEVAVAVVVLAFILFWLRRAAARSRERAPDSIKERLGVKEPEPVKVERKRPKAEPEPKVEEAKPAEEARAPEPEAPVSKPADEVEA